MEEKNEKEKNEITEKIKLLEISNHELNDKIKKFNEHIVDLTRENKNYEINIEIAKKEIEQKDEKIAELKKLSDNNENIIKENEILKKKKYIS